MQATNPATSTRASPGRDWPLGLWHLRRLAGYLSRGISIDSLCLLLFAMLCELPVLILRGLILLLSQVILNQLIGADITSPLTSLLLAAIWLWPPLALILPLGGGWWWKQIEGGRHPSQREQLAYQDSIEQLQAHSHKRLRLPTNWFVLDTPQPHAAACGDTLLLSRGLLESEYLPAVIAHELGHLTSTDGRLTAALNRMLLAPPKAGTPAGEQHPQTPPSTGIEVHFHGPIWLIAIVVWKLIALLLALARGGIVLRLTQPLWGTYWREREYRADAYAASLGQADDLANFLDNHALIHDLPIPLVWLTEHTHPPTELRIDRLHRYETRTAVPGAAEQKRQAE